MTKPKRQVGNPLGDPRITQDERACWAEMHHFARKLAEMAPKMLAYTEGEGGGPYAYDCLIYSARMHSAQDRALALRKGRMECERRMSASAK